MSKSFSAIVALGALGLSSLTAACSGGDTTTFGSGGGSGVGGSNIAPSAGGGAAVGGTTSTSGGAPATGGTEAGPGALYDGVGNWVEGTNNTVGIQGAFFALQDSVKDDLPVDDGLPHTILTPAPFSEGDETATPPVPADPACVSGELTAVTDPSGMPGCKGDTCQYSAQWGGGIGLNLNEPGGEGSVAAPWSATANGVTGFKFTLSGDCASCTVRFKATVAGAPADTTFCKKIAIGDNEVALADLVQDCWGSDGIEVLDVNNLEQIQWQLVTAVDTKYTVTDFCVSNLAYY